MPEFHMPMLGADMEAGTLVKWLVKPGDAVNRGDIVAEVETEKATVEVEIFDAGVIEQLVVPEGEEVPVGTLLATLRSPGLAPTAPVAVPRPSLPIAAPVPVAPPPAALPRITPAAQRLAATLSVDLGRLKGSGVGGAVTTADIKRAAATVPVQPAAAGRRAPSSPLARWRARERGIEIQAVAGTGPGGAVTLKDVEAAVTARLPAAPPSAEAPAPALPPAPDRLAARRHAIAMAMERSKREIPHYYLATPVDMTAALAWLQATNLQRPVTERLVYAALLIKAVALAAREMPEMNGYWREGSFQRAEQVNVGVAISLREGGLVAPAIHEADRRSLDELMAALMDLVKRARAGVLRSSEIAGPTITVTNLGEQGVDLVFPVIFAPQVAIVGFGKVVERPWAINGMLAVRPIIQASLAADHRASDGHRGGRFLAAVDRLLQEPAAL
jgi:pyruvate dehydrogenase E2 component (dihydrolipoamide acetyltransferase)